MSLATRCTACGTIFRVVQDQLKVSEGWVRCGRCEEVFNALEGLFDLDRDAPPQRSATAPAAASGARPAVGAAGEEFVASHLPREPSRPGAEPPLTREDDAIESRFLARASADEVEPEEHPEFADARFPSELPLDAVLAADDEPTAGGTATASEFPLVALRSSLGPASEPEPPPKPPRKPLLQRWRERREAKYAATESSLLEAYTGAQTSLPDVNSTVQVELADSTLAAMEAAAEQHPASRDKPRFVREAENAARWHRPRVRASLVVATALLLGLLTVQMAEQFRDAFAVQWPESRPVLEALCEVRGCTIQPLRRLAVLSVEASGLAPGEEAGTYRLSLTLNNRAAFAVAAPSIELSLTDASGALLARRAFAPADFAGAAGGAGRVAPGRSIAPGSDSQWQARIAARGLPVSGYTVELFYP